MAQLQHTVRVAMGWLLALACGRHAAAQEPSEVAERVRVQLTMPATCPERERFFGHLRDKLGPDWEAAPEELARTIDVTVASEPGRFIARIELMDARGQRVIRAVAGTECATVVDSIALIAVLAIQAQVDELISRSEPGEGSAAAPATPPPAATDSTPAVLERPRGRGPTPTSERGAARTLRLGGRAGIQQGIGPELTPTFGGFVGVAWERLVLGLAFDVATTGRSRLDDVPAELNLWAARLDGCARFWPGLPGLTIEPCAFVQAGQLTVEGISEVPTLVEPRRGSTAWLVPGVLAAARIRAGALFVGLEVSAGMSLDREHFYVGVEGAGRRTVYQVPAVTSGLALGGGVAF